MHVHPIVASVTKKRTFNSGAENDAWQNTCTRVVHSELQVINEGEAPAKVTWDMNQSFLLAADSPTGYEPINKLKLENNVYSCVCRKKQ